ncbi:hypothetical protein [Poseidonocella sp. HB161398]|uniref:hypothetical protein n=1 Tax=Poseidonocella sp. HB161398 TaxID=2320855 RepID=UPI00110860ED|nr:hypothetical protein [Poseidonocella sp. HB161398]
MAATLSELDFDGGFSDSFSAPTAIGVAGISSITGFWTAEDAGGYDYLVLTGLAPGLQTFHIDIRPVDGALQQTDHAYNGGAYVKYLDSQFAYDYDGRETVGQIDILHGDEVPVRVDVTTEVAPGGSVYLMLHDTNGLPGYPLFYEISGLEGAGIPVSVVPLPTAAPLLLGGLAVLGAIACRRRRS